MRAEMIAIPITLLLLLLVFGSVVAALLPLAIGALSVVGTFLVLLVVNQFTEVSVFALNLTTAMGLGLAIDYSLFIVSRYREELAAGHEPAEAVRRTVRTAGQDGALQRPAPWPRRCARCWCSTSPSCGASPTPAWPWPLLAGLYAIVVLPAMLAALGPTVDALHGLEAVDHARPTEGFWHRMAIAGDAPAGRRSPSACSPCSFVLGSPTLRHGARLPRRPGARPRRAGPRTSRT